MDVWSDLVLDGTHPKVCLRGSRIFMDCEYEAYLRYACKFIYKILPGEAGIYLFAQITYESPTRVQLHRKLWNALQGIDFADAEKGAEHVYKTGELHHFFSLMKIRRSDLLKALRVIGENDQFQLIASEKHFEEIDSFLSVLQGNENGIDLAPLNTLKETMYIEMDSLEHEYDLNIYLHQAYVLRFKIHPLIDTEVLVQMLMQNSRAFEGEALPIDLPDHFKEEGISNWIFLKIAGPNVHLANAAAHGFPCYSVRKYDDIVSGQYLGELQKYQKGSAL
ncbi:hypothetical protein P9D60_01020 [Bacillus spizizenii]|uniref:hypothetical protein n=1 Tax=Bacillus spizizenii TaxID=96241 RepID=UPI00165B3037|nr:hypothetical protein [Bacillus spizizenii]MEC1593588.1 hypothetical protein [Bacillus spizizenii]MEC1596124.1 hypothetical protein [Bacillus spizizenii]MEC1641352.1 hypothetical protein [Bacillus spizizenii]